MARIKLRAEVMSLDLSKRGREMPASPIRDLVPFADAAKRRGVHVYHLNIGQPDLDTPPELRERLSRIDATCLSYTPATGTEEFLQTMRRYYAGLGIRLRTDQILGTTGASEAILFAMIACADPGDDVMVVEPFYANYRGFAQMASLGVTAVTSRGRDGFHLPDRHVWDRQLTPRTRIVIICNPNNPTGAVYHREELDMVAEFCREKGLFLLSDEVYREFTFDGRRPISALELDEMDELLIVVDSLSKRYSSCGIRLGCLVTRNRDVYLSCARMAQARLAPPGLAQYLAIGISDLEQRYLAAVREEYQLRRDYLYDALRKIPGVFLRKPEGAFYFIAQLPIEDSTDFCRWMLAEFSLEGATVMLAPARGFYDHPGLGHDEVRIAYVLGVPELEKAVAALTAGLEAYRVAHDLPPFASEKLVSGS
ncbi:MAG: pyridoxal phosphate-dependent aminotransferase [Acidobacteria bacterium]|nr:pyridoxal phosphate-dependent aminotransferase [Acidobacteriota bacterium]